MEHGEFSTKPFVDDKHAPPACTHCRYPSSLQLFLYILRIVGGRK
jgi:hypothetical protein